METESDQHVGPIFLNRLEDKFGISGTGLIVEGFIFPHNKKVAFSWITNKYPPSDGLHQSEDIMKMIQCSINKETGEPTTLLTYYQKELPPGGAPLPKRFVLETRNTILFGLPEEVGQQFFTQVGEGIEFSNGHAAFSTIGSKGVNYRESMEEVIKDDCRIHNCGLRWIPLFAGFKPEEVKMEN